MKTRNVVQSDFLGKTVVDIDCAAVNCLLIKFSDGTSLDVFAGLRRRPAGTFAILEVVESEGESIGE